MFGNAQKSKIVQSLIFSVFVFDSNSSSTPPPHPHIFLCVCASLFFSGRFSQTTGQFSTSSLRAGAEWAGERWLPVTPLRLWSIITLTSLYHYQASLHGRTQAASHPGGSSLTSYLRVHWKDCLQKRDLPGFDNTSDLFTSLPDFKGTLWCYPRPVKSLYVCFGTFSHAATVRAHLWLCQWPL